MGRSAVRGGLLVLVATFAACEDDPTSPGPEADSWVDVVAGEAHACALSDAGDVYCWGSAASGQTGRAGATVSAPARVEISSPAVALAAGGSTTCAIDSDARLHCWGANQLGQLGDGSFVDSSTPVPVAGGPRWSRVSVGTYHVCGVDMERRVYCWGGDRWNVSLGYPASRECPAPVFEPTWPCSGGPGPRIEGWDRVEAGLYQTCVGRDGEAAAACWGTNELGQLGAATSQQCPSNDPLHATARPCHPFPLAPEGPPMSRIVPGATHSCGLDGNGDLFCWGALQLNFGQLGTGDLEGMDRPVPVTEPGPWNGVFTSHEAHIRTFSCGLGEDGSAFCWGANRWGQLGSEGGDPCGETVVACRPDPTPVSGGHRFVTLALGAEFACGLSTADEVLCWGLNSLGQLGDANPGSTATPVPVVF